LDEEEKDALFTVKGLWECIERINAWGTKLEEGS
jgi:Tfp pilus assembly protein PilN